VPENGFNNPKRICEFENKSRLALKNEQNVIPIAISLDGKRQPLPSPRIDFDYFPSVGFNVTFDTFNEGIGLSFIEFWVNNQN
jgi:hypothetical protein